VSDERYAAAGSDAPSSGLAIGSLIASILGLTLVPTVGSIVGLVLGYVARTKIEESAGAIGGESFAKAGIIVGWVGIGLTVAGVCLAIVITVLALSTVIPVTICAGLGNWFY
jgi:hypothetical protein